MKTQSELKVYSTGNYKYIYCYYKLNGYPLKIPTGCKVEEGKMTKENLYKSTMDDYVNLNAKITKIKSQVDRFITIKISREILIKNVKIKQSECLVYINRINSQEPTVKEFKKMVVDKQGVIYHFDNFYKRKAKEFPPYKIKYYISLKNSLLDYQKHIKQELTFDMMNTYDFCLDFRKFISTKHSDDYLTDGGLNDNTINKRFKSLKTFFRYLDESEIYTFKSAVRKFEVNLFPINLISLTESEVKALLKFDFKLDSERTVIDLFCLNCYLGLRFSDLYTLKEKDFPFVNGHYSLKKETQKTGEEVEIPIVPFALGILKKYNFDLPKFSNQYFNRALKEILKNHDLFNEAIVKKNRILGVNHDESLLKREYISSHTARRSFITNCIERNIPLNLIMAATGHKDIRTVNRYIVKKQNTERFLSGFEDVEVPNEKEGKTNPKANKPKRPKSPSKAKSIAANDE